MKDLWQDLRIGFRILVRKPAFTAAAVLSLTLGIGVNTAIYALLDQTLWNPLPVGEPDRLVALFHNLQDSSGAYTGYRGFSYPNYLDLREEAETLDALGLYFWQSMSLSGGSEPERVTVMYVTDGYFELLGLEPARGRFFAPEEVSTPGAETVAVLTHGAWRRLFGSDPEVVGKTVSINGHSFTVVGVAPPRFRGTELAGSADLFIPATLFATLSPYGQYFEVREIAIFRGVGRLAPGATVEQADAEMMLLSQRLAEAYPADFEGLGGMALPLVEAAIYPTQRERYQSSGLVVMGAVLLVLLVACLNVANLLLARGLERAQELAVRGAVGACRSRLARQLLTETLLLFGVGGLLSLPVAHWSLRGLWALRPPQFPDEALDLQLDLRMLVFAFAVALTTGLLFGLLPALRAARTDLVSSLKESPRRARVGTGQHAWLEPRSLLVAAQIGLALVSLLGAGLFVRGLAGARQLDLGFEPEGLAAIGLSPGDQGYDEVQGRELYRRVLERVEALPGVSGAALSENRLLGGGKQQKQVFVEGQEEAIELGGRDFQRTNVVSPGFFRAVGIPLIEGRDFRAEMADDAPLEAIVNQTAARALWPGGSAVGKRFHFAFPTEPLVEVVGVVADATYRDVGEPAQVFVYLPLAQSYVSAMTLHVRTESDPAAMLPALRQAIGEVDPNVPVIDPVPISQVVEEAYWLQGTLAKLSSLFGLLALGLAAVGVYGVVSYWVARRRRELALRIALGARRSQVVKTLYRQLASLLALGVLFAVLLVALLLSLDARELITRELQSARLLDPVACGLALLALVAVTFAACALPARRALAAEPMQELRTE